MPQMSLQRLVTVRAFDGVWAVSIEERTHEGLVSYPRLILERIKEAREEAEALAEAEDLPLIDYTRSRDNQ